MPQERLTVVEAKDGLTTSDLDDLFKANVNANANHTAWDFKLGNPEMFRDADKMLVKEGRVLDLGSGPGLRSSFMFLVNGMDVDALDTTPIARESAIEKHRKLGMILPELGALAFLKFDFFKLDPRRIDGDYDVVIADQFLIHAPCADLLKPSLEKMAELLKTGGKLWLRCPGAHDLSAQYGYRAVHRSGVTSEPDECHCSGELSYDSTSYFNYFELASIAAELGLKVLDQNVSNNRDIGINVMYGDSYNSSAAFMKGDGTMTFLWQKS